MGTLVTEAELRELWRNGRGEIPRFPAGTRFSPAARDFLKDHGFTVSLEGTDGARPGGASLETAKGEPGAGDASSEERGVVSDHPTGNVVSGVGGGQEGAGQRLSRAAPRRKLRTQVDSLRSQLMLVAAQARRHGISELIASLDCLANYCTEILQAESAARPVAPLVLPIRSTEELDEIAGWPEGHLALRHVGPSPDDHEVLHWLNVVRTQALEAEVTAWEAFPPDWPEAWALGEVVARSLSRVASAAYALSLLGKAGAAIG